MMVMGAAAADDDAAADYGKTLYNVFYSIHRYNPEQRTGC